MLQTEICRIGGVSEKVFPYTRLQQLTTFSRIVFGVTALQAICSLCYVLSLRGVVLLRPYHPSVTSEDQLYKQT